LTGIAETLSGILRYRDISPWQQRRPLQTGATHEVNATGTAPADEVVDAVERNDFRKFNALERAKALKRRRGY